MNGAGPPAELLDRLMIPDEAEAAAREYLRHPDWLTGPPPAAVLAVLTDPQISQDGDVVRLARAWPARDLLLALGALIEAGLGLERDRRAAWIVKQTVVTEQAGPVLRLAADRTRDRVVRRFLIEGVSRALSGEPESWARVASVTQRLIDDDDPLIREAGAQLIHDSQGESGERAALLVGLLADGDDTVVLTAARALQAMPSAPIPTDAIAALGRHRHPEAQRMAGELLSRNASGPPTEQRPGT